MNEAFKELAEKLLKKVPKEEKKKIVELEIEDGLEVNSKKNKKCC